MRQAALSGLMAVAMSTAAFAEDVSITTARGDVTLPANPETVAVYDMAALDSLTALGVVPAATIDEVLVPELRDGVADAARVGTLFEPDLEALAGVGPDLTIVGGRSSTQLDAVSQVGTAIDMTFGDDLLASAEERIAAYGTLFDREDRAAEMIAQIDAGIEAAKSASAGKGDLLVVMTNGPKMAAYGADSRFGWIHEATGLPEAVEGVDRADHGQGISHEFIAEADPDWLLVLDRTAAIGAEGQAAAETLKSDLVAGTTAWQQDQVIMLDPASTYISAGGFTSLTGTIDRLTQAFANASSS